MPAHAVPFGATLPFPVNVPYVMRADLVRLADSPFLEGPDADAVRRAKADALRTRPERVRGVDPARPPGAIAADVAATLPTLADVRPDVVRPARAEDDAAVPDPDGDRAWAFPRLGPSTVRRLAAEPAVTRLADALALSLPEDLVWMHDDGDAGRAALLHVAFPSHWAPDARGGASLAELHGPVADGERLRAASRGLMRAIAAKGPFERHVFSLNPTGSLDRHPRAVGPAGRPPGPAGDDPLAATWFRVERQTTLPFPDARVALFLIRVLVAPLTEVLDAEPGRAARLAASIRSMTPAVRRYKGLTDGGDAILAALDARAARDG